MRILVVTGASRGIGAATARLAAARGYDVWINYRRDQRAAAGVVRSIRDAGGTAIAGRADVAEVSAVGRLFATVDHELGRSTRW